MPRYHRYKHKSGGYWRGRSRGGKYYTRKGCMVLFALAVPATVLGGLILRSFT